MSETISVADARRAAAAHDRLITALYGGELLELDEPAGARLVFNPWIEEPEWNHAGGLALDDDAAAIAGALARLRDRLARRGRRPALVVDPFTRPASLGRRLAASGWTEVFRHSALLWPRERAAQGFTWPAGAALAERGAPPVADLPGGVPPAPEAAPFPEMTLFAEVFERSFAETAGGELSSGYRTAFPAAMARPLAGVEVVHSLVTLDGAAVAVGSRATADGVCGLYNLGVLPSHRRFGLGGAITLHRVAAARAAGAEVIYLLTEDPRVEAAQLGRGFVKAFELVGWQAPVV